ncbi:MAG: 6-carboxytetrahydropterin synthase [Chloroflexi bacterium]|nr:6-carboxytetrahydropterin synthase [Chloroflexota bacterium]MBI5956940.1 6-carboxytetrahydropterin synthase [Chloroflexota bacterium]
MGFKVIVEQGNLRFGAAHFITLGGKCERLHGHNYAVSVAVEGPLAPDSYVFDFVVLKEIVRRITEALDHRFLLPLRNEQLSMQESEGHWEIRFGERRYVFPARDVLPLPVDNVTAERLAEYIWGEVAKELRDRGVDHLISMNVGVEEAPGQTAWYSQELS